jgi:hypothetical protein
MEAAALYLRGNLSNTELALVNSTLTVAAGAQTFDGFYAGIDRRQLRNGGADPQRLRLLGNVFSVTFPGNYAACGTGEFDATVKSEINTATSHICHLSTNVASWHLASNQALHVTTAEHTNCTPLCGAGSYCFSGACNPRQEDRVLSFLATGYPRNVDLNYVYGSTGVALTGLPHASDVARDRAGRSRNIAVREGAGAYLR